MKILLTNLFPQYVRIDTEGSPMVCILKLTEIFIRQNNHPSTLKQYWEIS